MSRIGVLKYKSRVKRALEVKNGDDIWVVIGKTSEWANEASPDAPLPGLDNLVEPFVAIKPCVKSLAKDISLSEYALLSDSNRASALIDGVATYFQLVSDSDAYNELARFLYLKAIFDPVITGHPSVEYFRTYYATSGLIPSAGYENATWLIPDNIDDYGLVEYENAGTKLSGTVAVSLPIVLHFR
jgi:hypothetical protein